MKHSALKLKIALLLDAKPITYRSNQVWKSLLFSSALASSGKLCHSICFQSKQDFDKVLSDFAGRNSVIIRHHHRLIVIKMES